MKTAALMIAFFREKDSISCLQTAGRRTGSRRASEVAFSPSLAVGRVSNPVDREPVPRRHAHDVRREHEGNARRDRAPRGDGDRRDARAVGGFEDALVVLGHVVAEDVHEHRGALRLAARPHRRRIPTLA